MKNSKQLRNEHAKRYIQAVFERRLKEEGFVCPDEKLLCWYRVKNREIVHTLIFFSLWSNIPLSVCIGYGIHPLFNKPIFHQGIDFPKRPINNDECFCEQSIIENYPVNAMRYCQYAENIAVYAPEHSGRGLYTFDGVLLPAMDSACSVRTAYEYHKHRRSTRRLASLGNELGVLSRSFIDMALYLDDREVYPLCRARIPEAVCMYKKLCAKFPGNTEYRQSLADWEQLHTAFFDCGRDEYLAVLEERKNENIAYLKNTLGLDIK